MNKVALMVAKLDRGVVPEIEAAAGPTRIGIALMMVSDGQAPFEEGEPLATRTV